MSRRPSRYIPYAYPASACMLMAALALTAYAIGTRPFYVGADTAVYAEYFERYQRFLVHRFEPGFSIITYVLRALGVNTALYFSSLYLMMCAFFIIFVQISLPPDEERRIERMVFMCLVFASLLFSRWFENAGTNGIRQGMAAPLVYVALTLLLRRSFISASLVGAAALSFHASAALVFLVSPLLFLSSRVHAVVFSGACVAYVFGINAGLVRALPPVFGFNIYQAIVEFAADRPIWAGPQGAFIAYTCFFMLAFSVASRTLAKSSLFAEYVKIYSILSIMYFLFGFGAFSNRFASYAWLFTSIPVARLAYEVTPSPTLRVGLAFTALLAGTVYFMLRVSGSLTG